MHFPPRPAACEIFPRRIGLVLKRKSGGRRGGGEEERGEGRGAPSRPELEPPPRGREPRNVRSDRRARGGLRRRAGRGCAHLNAGGGASAGTTPPPPLCAAPLARRLGPFRPRFGAARLPSRPSLPPSFSPSWPGRAGSSGRKFAAAPSAPLRRLTWPPTPRPAPRPPKLLPGKGLPGQPAPDPRTRPPEAAGPLVAVRVQPPPLAAQGLRASPRHEGVGGGDLLPAWPRGGQESQRADRWRGLAPVPLPPQAQTPVGMRRADRGWGQSLSPPLEGR